MEKRTGWWLLLGAGALLLLGGGAGYYMMMARMSGPRWDRLLPETKARTLALLAAAQAAGLQVMFFKGWRDPAVEAQNIQNGTSHLKDPYDTRHTWGAAVDLTFKNALGMPYWPPVTDPRWKQLAELGVAQGFKSGGLSWGWDWGHFELPNFDLAGIRSTYGRNYLAYLSNNGVAVA